MWKVDYELAFGSLTLPKELGTMAMELPPQRFLAV
jgi:hypothetical protein